MSSSCPTPLGPISGHSGGIILCSGSARVTNLRARLSESSTVCLAGSPWQWQPGGCEQHLWLLLGAGVSVGNPCCLVMGGSLFWRHCWVLVMSREDDFLLSVPAGSCCAAGNGTVLPGRVQPLHCPECYGKGICCALSLCHSVPEA